MTNTILRLGYVVKCLIFYFDIAEINILPKYFIETSH